MNKQRLLWKQIVHIFTFISFFTLSAGAVAVYFPATPELIFPADKSTIQIETIDSPVIFRWDTVLDSDDYLVSVQIEGQPLPATHITTETTCPFTFSITKDKLPVQITWGVLPRKNGRPPHALMPEESRTFTLKLYEIFPTATPVPQMTPTPAPVLLPAPVLFFPKNGDKLDLNDFYNTQFEWSEISGAASYKLTVYDKNEPNEIYVPVTRNPFPFSFPNVRTVYQWTVQAIDEKGNSGLAPNRFSFITGDGLLPTPTPMNLQADMNQDQKNNALDLFLYALSFDTNDPSVDFNNSGINEREDLLLFIKKYLENRP